MRIKFLGLAIAALTTLGPMQAFGGDREIAEQIIQRLKTNRDSGALKDFTLDMKVDQGVVLFRGSVDRDQQKDLVLATADGVDGVVKVVDEMDVNAVTVVKPKATVAVANNVGDSKFSLRDALKAEADTILSESTAASPELVPVHSEVRPAAAVELAAPASSADQRIVSGVVGALGKAQKSGQLKGFGVDVKCSNGVVTLKGRCSSAGQRNRIVQITEKVSGVQRVRNSISVPNALPAPQPLRDSAASTQAKLKPVSAPVNRQVQATPASAPVPTPVVAQIQPPVAAPAMPMAPSAMPTSGPVMGQPVMGTPMPMANYGAGAPMYDSPNLPNYAWPGYSAYPNYAALSYPQQYSPSAWPYIGPFYPYPQVPLGWRRVSLEWKDGWWFLDFTDKYR